MRPIKMLPWALVVVCSLVAGAQAATVYFDINLDGLQEVPPVATPGYGLGTLTLDDATGDFSISGNFYDLIGTTTVSHIHGAGGIGVNAGVVVALTVDLGVSTGTFSGAGTFTAPQMTDLLNELYYVNVHSTFKPGGEIRGQIRVSDVPEPSSLALLSGGGLAMAIAWRRRRK